MTNIINPFKPGHHRGKPASKSPPIRTRPTVRASTVGQVVRHNLTQDMTNQFFGTFPSFPSITHTDPHYHAATSAFRAAFGIASIRSPGSAMTMAPHLQLLSDRRAVFDIGISNLYVPGLETHFSADAERYVVALPLRRSTTSSLSSCLDRQPHPHARGLVQRVINQVAVNPP